MRRPALQIIFLVALFGWFLAVESRRELDFIEAGFGDWLDANAPRHTPAPSVTLVEINDESLGKEKRWPWSPLNYLLFLQAAQQHSFGVTAVEPVFDWSKASPMDEKQGHLEYEKILQDFVRKMPKILLGARLGFPEDPDVVAPLEAVPQIRRVSGDITKLPQFTAIEREPKEGMRLSATLGFTNILTVGPLTRTVPLLFNYRGQIVPSFALQAAIMWFKLTVDDVQVVAGSHVALGQAVKIPVDAAGNMRVDFHASVLRVGSADLLLAAQQAEQRLKPVAPVDDWNNHVVLIARTDPAWRTLQLPVAIERANAESISDNVEKTKTDPRAASPGELLAQAVATIQNKSFVRHAPASIDIGIIVAAMVVSYFAVGACLTKNRALIALLFFVGYLFASITIFGIWLIAMPLILPVGLALFVVIFAALSPRG